MMGPLLMLAAAAVPVITSVNQTGGITTSRVGDLTISSVIREASEACLADVRMCALPDPQPWEQYSTESRDYQVLRAFEVAKQYCPALVNPAEGYTLRDMIDKFRSEYLGLSEKAWLEKMCLLYRQGVEDGGKP